MSIYKELNQDIVKPLKHQHVELIFLQKKVTIINLLIADTIQRVKKLPPQTQFTLPDLYTGLEWKEVSKADRILLGRLFSDYAKNNSIVEMIGKTSNNKKIYLKK